MSQTACRFCGASVDAVFADLGMSPLANSYLPPERANSMEPFYPMRALVCRTCFLVQLEEFETPERIFSEYAWDEPAFAIDLPTAEGGGTISERDQTFGDFETSRAGGR
jgi:hypothetical protein